MGDKTCHSGALPRGRKATLEEKSSVISHPLPVVGVARSVEKTGLDAILAANIFVVGAVNALDLLLEPTRLRATLRY